MSDTVFFSLIEKLGLPLAMFSVLVWGLWKAGHEVGAWVAASVDRLSAFVAPLSVRLIEATELNARNSAAILEQLRSMAESDRWHHGYVQDGLTELRAGVKTAIEQSDEALELARAIATSQTRQEARQEAWHQKKGGAA